MYNRYIGNTGKFYRVEEPEIDLKERTPVPPVKPAVPPVAEHEERHIPHNPDATIHESIKGLLPQNLAGGIKDVLKGILPGKIDIGDILLILVLLLLYLENEDEEILIILGALIFLGFK